MCREINLKFKFQPKSRSLGMIKRRAKKNVGFDEFDVAQFSSNELINQDMTPVETTSRPRRTCRDNAIPYSLLEEIHEDLIGLRIQFSTEFHTVNLRLGLPGAENFSRITFKVLPINLVTS